MRRFLAVFLILGWALAAPLPNVPNLPDGTRVEVVGQNLTSKYARGTITKKVLTLTADKARLPSLEKVNLWLAVPNNDVVNIVGTVSKDGKDIMLELAKEKVSFEDTLREAYGIKIEWKTP